MTVVGDDPLLVLRQSHHTLACLLAQVLNVTDFTPQRIAIFLNDPAFQDLLEHYRLTLVDGPGLSPK